MKLSGIQAVFRLSTLHIKANSSQGGNMPKDNDNYQLAPPTSAPSLRCSISMPMISVSCSRIFMASHLYISIGTDITCQTIDITCQNKHASGSQKFRNILHFGSSHSRQSYSFNCRPNSWCSSPAPAMYRVHPSHRRCTSSGRKSQPAVAEYAAGWVAMSLSNCGVSWSKLGAL